MGGKKEESESSGRESLGWTCVFPRRASSPSKRESKFGRQRSKSRDSKAKLSVYCHVSFYRALARLRRSNGRHSTGPPHDYRTTCLKGRDDLGSPKYTQPRTPTAHKTIEKEQTHTATRSAHNKRNKSTEICWPVACRERV